MFFICFFELIVFVFCSSRLQFTVLPRTNLTPPSSTARDYFVFCAFPSGGNTRLLPPGKCFRLELCPNCVVFSLSLICLFFFRFPIGLQQVSIVFQIIHCCCLCLIVFFFSSFSGFRIVFFAPQVSILFVSNFAFVFFLLGCRLFFVLHSLSLTLLSLPGCSLMSYPGQVQGKYGEYLFLFLFSLSPFSFSLLFSRPSSFPSSFLKSFFPSISRSCLLSISRNKKLFGSPPLVASSL